MLSLYMISKKQLNQLIEEKSPQLVLNAKSPRLYQEAPCHELQGLGHHMGQAGCMLSRCLPGPDGDSDSNGTLPSLTRSGCVWPSLRSHVVYQYGAKT